MTRFTPMLSLTTCCTAALLAGPAKAVQIQVDTPLGSYTLQTREDAAPNTVANFLAYISDGRYEDSIIHRSAPGFVVQGGGFTYTDGDGLQAVAQYDMIDNEFSLPNLRGTVAMAKLAAPEDGGPANGGPNSATSQWFINLSDNASLDVDNGGYTVFAEVVSGMDVVDAIASQTRWDARGYYSNGAMGELPLLDSFTNAGPIQAGDFVTTTYTIIPEPASAALLVLGALAVTRRRRG